MSNTINPMAQAWIDAARDLRIRLKHPFTFTANDGTTATTLGVFLPDFGSQNGTIITCRFDGDDVHIAADKTEYYQSVLNPLYYEPYDRKQMVEVLNDLGWFGSSDNVPPWFAGGVGRHGG